MARPAQQRGMYGMTGPAAAIDLLARVAATGAEIPGELTRLAGAVDTIEAHAASLRADAIDPARLAVDLADTDDPAGVLADLGARVQGEATRRLVAQVLAEAIEAAQARAAAAVRKAAPEQLVKALRPAYQAAADEAATIVAKHPGIGNVDRADAVDLDPDALDAWRRLGEARAQLGHLWTLGEELRDRATLERGHELLLRWEQLPDGAARRIEAASYPYPNANVRAPSFADLLEAGAILRPLPTRSEVGAIIEDQRQDAEDRMDRRRARAGLQPTTVGADPAR